MNLTQLCVKTLRDGGPLSQRDRDIIADRLESLSAPRRFWRAGHGPK